MEIRGKPRQPNPDRQTHRPSQWTRTLRERIRTDSPSKVDVFLEGAKINLRFTSDPAPLLHKHT